MKYFIIFAMFINSASAGFTMTARQAKLRTNKALQSQKTQCVRNWELALEDEIDATVNKGVCSLELLKADCVSDAFFQATIKTLRHLGYRIHNVSELSDGELSWCER